MCLFCEHRAAKLSRNLVERKTRSRQLPILIRKLCRRSQFGRIQTPTAGRALFQLVKLCDEAN